MVAQIDRGKGLERDVRLPADATGLFNAKGKPVGISARGAGAGLTAMPSAELGAGTYVLVWRVVSADGHPVAGSLTFSVNRPSPTVVDPPSGPGRGGGTDVRSPPLNG